MTHPIVQIIVTLIASLGLLIPGIQATTEPDYELMSHAQFMAADVDTQVTVETYVQATQSWWNDTINVYAQSPDGGYFIYEMSCTEEQAAQLTPGTKIRVTGDKALWSGLPEIMNATFEFVDEERFVAIPMDMNGRLGTSAMEQQMNKKVHFSGMTVEAIAFKNGAPGDDIYLTLSQNGLTCEFCVEVYLTGPETEVYRTVCDLEVGDTVDVTAMLYWYEGPNPHILEILAY